MSEKNVSKSSSDSATSFKMPSFNKAISQSKLMTKDNTLRENFNENKSPPDLRRRKTLEPNQALKLCYADGINETERNKQFKDTLTTEQSIRQGKVEGEESSESLKAKDISKDTRANYLCLMILTSLSFLTRLHNIEVPAHICWDETHFGKMGSWYINRTFFFDVHPPLGKMLIGLAGVMTGYDGSYPFEKPGDPYGDAEYVGMRVFCAVLGALLVPLCYQCVWILTNSVMASLFAGAIVLTDTGTLTLSRHILLDPILMFFIALATWCCLKALSYRSRQFSFMWWLWMSATGASLAGALGVKFVGLFVVLFVGYTTAADLWSLLGNLSLSMTKLVQHLVARAMCLIALPIVVYCCFFAVHFHILNHSGNGDGFFSSAFQSQLIGNRLYNVSMPQYIAYGSEITLKQRRTGGAYLHSHPHLYPEEHPPRQQQVTTYSHKDENNRWLIKPADRELTEGNHEKAAFVYSGDLIRLEHIVTRRNLHSHKEFAPLTKHHYQVSGYGQNGSGDANDIWIVEVDGGSRGDKIMTVRSRLRLVHYTVGCVLSSHDKKLPKWGWEQMEVTCQPDTRDSNAVWNVEEVKDSRLENVNFNVYSPSFVEKFIESHSVMTQGNRGLKPKDGELTSQPWHWPINYRGQMFSGPNHRIYLLGNPILFWSLLGLKVAFILLWVGLRVVCKRGLLVNKPLLVYCDRMVKVCWWLLLGWFLHYAPFWAMTRVLYFHHYFPAFLFSAMFGGVMLDLLLTLVCVCAPPGLTKSVFMFGLVFLLGGMVYSLYLFHPLVYGMIGPTSANKDSVMYGLQWMSSWDI